MSNIEALQGFGSLTGMQKNDSADTLGKEDFLTLLVTQLQNQDPLNPSDPTEFTAQLAQYSSLEQLHNLNDSMAAFESVQAESERLSALSLIGKNVVSDSDTFRYEGGTTELGYQFDKDVEQATLYVKNGAGQVIDEIRVNAPGTGENFISWPGSEAEGEDLPTGQYSLEAIGHMEDGMVVQGGTRVSSLVTGVDFLGSENMLLTENGNFLLSDISRVKVSTVSD